MSFGAVAADYDRLRPTPPDVAVRWVVPAGCGTAVDVGAGTGLLTRALAGVVPRVVAVEPDPRMRAQLSSRSPEVEALAGRAEEIPLPDACADLVTVASAWHWMEPERVVPEVARVLRDGGRFAVLWTGRDREESWLRELSLGPTAFEEWRRSESLVGGWRARAERRRELRLPAGAPFKPPESTTFAFTRRLSPEDFVAWLGTHSGVIVADAEERAAYLNWARAQLEARFPGQDTITLPMRARCWRCERLPRE